MIVYGTGKAGWTWCSTMVQECSRPGSSDNLPAALPAAAMVAVGPGQMKDLAAAAADPGLPIARRAAVPKSAGVPVVFDREDAGAGGRRERHDARRSTRALPGKWGRGHQAHFRAFRSGGRLILASGVRPRQCGSSHGCSPPTGGRRRY